MAVKERARAVESPRPALQPAKALAPERQSAVPTGPLRAPGPTSPAPVIEQEKELVPGAAALAMPGLSGAPALHPADRQRSGSAGQAQAPAQGNARIARRMRAGEQGPATDYEASRPGQVAAASPAPAPTGLMGSRAVTAPSQPAAGTAAPAPTAEPAALTATAAGPPAPTVGPAAPVSPVAAAPAQAVVTPVAAAQAAAAAPAAMPPAAAAVSPAVAPTQAAVTPMAAASAQAAAAAPAAMSPAAAGAPPAAPRPTAAGTLGTPRGAGPGAASPSPAAGAAAQAAAEAPAAAAGPSPVTAAAAAAGRRRARGPNDDPGFRAVVTRVKKAAAGYRRHGSAHGAAASAQAAAPGPANEMQAGAKAQQVAKIDAQHPKEFDKATFAALLRSKVDAKAPKNPVEARDFPSSGKLGELKTEMTGAARTSAADAGADVRDQAQAAPDQSGITPKPVTPLPETPAAPPPGDLGAAQAAPKPLPAADVSAGVQAQQQQLDGTMTQAGVTDQQLAAANEPTFAKALGDKQAAGQAAAAMPAQYRAAESATIASAQAQAVTATGRQTAAMHGQSAALLGQVTGQQHGTMAADQAARANITAGLEKIYENTKAAVEQRLAKLDKDAGDAFDAALTEARQAFESYVQTELDKRYSDIELWIKDKLLTWGLPAEVQAIFDAGRARFIESMDAAIDRVAGLVADGLSEAKQKSADGRKQVDEEVNRQPAALRAVAREAAQSIGVKFDQLDQSITAKQDQLADTLAAKYADGLKQLDDRITQLESEHASLISKALSSVTGVISTILEMKNLLLKVLAKAVATINVIIADPIGFLGHLVDAVGLGIKNFVGNILTHLKQGFFEWLFGEVASAGITLPKTWDLKGIFGLVMQILGLTWPSIRKIAVEVVGEPIVHALETAAEPIIVLIREGPAGLWNWIKEQLGNLKAMVVDQLQSWLITNVIKAGITWLIGLLNPASAFIKACKAIYDILEFIWTRGKQILEFVNAVVDSIAEIAAGSLGKAAQKVEDALARAIPVTIGFLASLLGLGDLGETIKGIIDKIQEPVHAAVKWLITKAVALVKAVGKLLGFGKEKEEGKQKEAEHPIYDAVRQALHEQLGEGEEADHIHKVAGNVLTQFQPQGLRKLDVVQDEETGVVSVMAQASPPANLIDYAPDDRDVFMNVTVTLDEKKPTSLDRLRYIARSRSLDPSYRGKLPRGTDPSQLPMVDDPIAMIGPVGGRTAAGGALEIGEGGTQIKVLTWNTGDRKKWAASEDNSTHAEHQFADWLSRQEFRSEISAIDVSMSSRKQQDSPCPSCVDDLKKVARFTPNAAGKRKLSYTGIYTSKAVNEDAAVQALTDLGKNGWDLPGLAKQKSGGKLHPVK